MADTVEFELVSPEKLLLSEPVAMVVVPGSEGNFGVLPGHTPLISTVRPGLIDVYATDPNTITDRIFVAGGFAEVTGERVTVLAEEAVPLKDLDRAALETELRNLTDDVRDAKTDEVRGAAEAKLAIAQAKLDAISWATTGR